MDHTGLINSMQFDAVLSFHTSILPKAIYRFNAIPDIQYF